MDPSDPPIQRLPTFVDKPKRRRNSEDPPEDHGKFTVTEDKEHRAVDKVRVVAAMDAEMKKDVSKKDDEIENLKSTVSEKDDEIEDLKSTAWESVDEWADSNEDTELQIQSLHEEISNLKAQRDGDRQKADSLQNRIDEFETEQTLLSDQREPLGITETNLSAQIGVLEKEKEDLVAQIAQLAASNEERGKNLNRITQLEDENKQLQEDDDRHFGQVQALEEDLDETSAELMKAKGHNEALQKALDDCNADATELTKLKGRNEALQKALDESKADETELTKLRDSNEALQKALDESKTNATVQQKAAELFTAAHQDCETLRTQVKTLSDNLKESQNRKDELYAQIEDEVSRRVKDLKGQLRKEYEDEWVPKLQSTFQCRVQEEVGRRLQSEPLIQQAQQKLESEIKENRKKMDAQSATYGQYKSSTDDKIEKLERSVKEVIHATLPLSFLGLALIDVFNSTKSEWVGCWNMWRKKNAQLAAEAHVNSPSDAQRSYPIPAQGGSSTPTVHPQSQCGPRPQSANPPQRGSTPLRGPAQDIQMPSAGNQPQVGSTAPSGGQPQSQGGPAPHMGSMNPPQDESSTPSEHLQLQRGPGPRANPPQATPLGGQAQDVEMPPAENLLQLGSNVPSGGQSQSQSGAAPHMYSVNPLQGGSSIQPGGHPQSQNGSGPSKPSLQTPTAQPRRQSTPARKQQRRPNMVAVRKTKNQRGEERTKALKEFRKYAQRHIGITKDGEIDKLLKTRATPEELADHEKNETSPTFRDGEVYPLEMDGEDLTRSSWNSAVGELLIAAYLLEHPPQNGGGGAREEEDDDEDEDDVVDCAYLSGLWKDRLRCVKKAQTDIAHAAEDPEFMEAMSKAARRTTHRNQLFNRRQRSGQLAFSNQAKKQFAVLFKAVSGQVMSSDEEIGTQRRKKACAVVRKDWRHTVLINIFKWLDYNADHNKLTASGTSQGPAPHSRIRTPIARDTQQSASPVIMGLPRNLYCPVYLASLSQMQLADLKPGDPIDLPVEVLELETNQSFDLDEHDTDENWRPKPKQDGTRVS
ncbi:hypothetical protein B0H12DRAFT_1242612 [Mycena haematopus]|nr:hypothetical protein B0H12DRAFT_1242612 [Mycena haematopus]